MARSTGQKGPDYSDPMNRVEAKLKVAEATLARVRAAWATGNASQAWAATLALEEPMQALQHEAYGAQKEVEDMERRRAL